MVVTLVTTIRNYFKTPHNMCITKSVKLIAKKNVR